MDKPKLVGMISLRFGRQRRQSESPEADRRAGVKEMIRHVAFDTEGLAWGLVERQTPIDKESNISRLTFDRFVAFPGIPFHREEIVDEDKWIVVPKE